MGTRALVNNGREDNYIQEIDFNFQDKKEHQHFWTNIIEHCE